MSPFTTKAEATPLLFARRLPLFVASGFNLSPFLLSAAAPVSLVADAHFLEVADGLGVLAFFRNRDQFFESLLQIAVLILNRRSDKYLLELSGQFGIKLKVRQAQMWMHRLGYRLKHESYAYLQARSEDAQRFSRALKKPKIRDRRRRWCLKTRRGLRSILVWVWVGPNAAGGFGFRPQAGIGRG